MKKIETIQAEDLVEVDTLIEEYEKYLLYDKLEGMKKWGKETL